MIEFTAESRRCLGIRVGICVDELPLSFVQCLQRNKVSGEVSTKLGLPLEVGVHVPVMLVQIRADDSENIAFLSAVEVAHAPQSVCANDDAPWNIRCMLVTLDTSQSERSTLNDDAM